MLHIESIQKQEETDNIGENSLIKTKNNNNNIHNNNIVEKEIDQNINNNIIEEAIVTIPCIQLSKPIIYDRQLDNKIGNPIKNFKQLGIFKRMRSSY